MTVRNWEQQRLGMDFGNICVPCSDIDLMHVTAGGWLVLGEIKNETGELKGMQRKLLASIVDQYKAGGVVIYMKHNKYVERDDKTVDVAGCKVVEYYWNGRWIVPETNVTVNEIMKYLEVRSMGATIEGKAKVWAREHEGGWTSYSVSVSTKDQNGNWVNAYQPVRFKKDAPKIENGTEINYKGFATVMKGKEHNYVLWQITEFTFAGNEAAHAAEPPYSQLTENDIPF